MKGRPEHEDMHLLFELILQMEGQIAEGSRDVADIAGEIVDPKSLSWLAVQRMRRGDESTGSAFTMRGQVTAAALFMEGFVMGARFRDRRPKVEEG